MVSVRSRFVMVNGVKTHYTESGGDTPVIVGLHGGGHGSSGAAGLGKLFELLGERYRVIGLDSVGGYGETDPHAPSPYGLQSRVDHLSAFVDALCLDRFTIMGNSQGAWVAAKYAITHPDRVDKMVLLSSGSISSAMGIKSQPSEGMKLLQGYDGSREAMKRLLQGLVYNAGKITDALIDLRQAAATRPGAMESFAAAGKQIKYLQNDPAMSVNYDMRVSLPAVSKVIPTIFIWGENDIFAIPEVGRQLEKLLPDVKFHWVKNAGHQVQTDQPEIVAELITGVPARVAAAV
ncbi:MAG TPA: alpha/beta hydrolase [Candidatus Binatia bacterium]|nr:alpha/beta hydrolase [Candidatus Binatia bacterium]